MAEYVEMMMDTGAVTKESMTEKFVSKNSYFFYEVKRQASDINIGILKDKAEHFFEKTGKFKSFKIEYKGLSMEDM